MFLRGRSTLLLGGVWLLLASNAVADPISVEFAGRTSTTGGLTESSGFSGFVTFTPLRIFGDLHVGSQFEGPGDLRFSWTDFVDGAPGSRRDFIIPVEAIVHFYNNDTDGADGFDILIFNQPNAPAVYFDFSGFDLTGQALSGVIPGDFNLLTFPLTHSFFDLNLPGNQFGQIIGPDLTILQVSSAVSPIPEPSTLILVGSGTIAFAHKWRRRRGQSGLSVRR
jgi:hypothetical protein